MWRKDEKIYLLCDTESPLANILSSAYIAVLDRLADDNFVIREFKNPPQPLYRGGMINPDNPHADKQNRVITAHNIDENNRVWLNHHEVFEVKKVTDTSLSTHKKQEHELLLSSQKWEVLQEQKIIEEWLDGDIESIKNELISLPKGSIVILVQSTNFRLSTFRIRLELFHRGIHVVEHNHLAYIPDSQLDTFIDSLTYRTDEYVRLESVFSQLVQGANNTRIQSVNGKNLVFWPLENIRGNTGNYFWVENKWGTFPIWEVFTEAIDLKSVNGSCLIETYPREDFSIEICDPFELVIENGRVLPSSDFPPGFQKLYDWVVQYEGEVMVRELWFWLNPAISTATPLRDINFHERKVWVHLSLWKKHGIYGKKLPKTEMQRFHIDVFVALESVYIADTQVFQNGRWSV